MWQEINKQIKLISKTSLTVEDYNFSVLKYCEKLLNTKIELSSDFLNNQNCYNLFFNTTQIHNWFLNNQINYIFSIFCNEFCFKEQLNKELKEWLKNNLFLKEINYLPETTLSQDKIENTTIFLFLYYHPYLYKNSLIFHPITNRPLISYKKITNNHFDMLLFLMKTEAQEEFLLFQQTPYNINFQLIENIIDNSKEVYYDEDNWDKILNKYKITTLLDNGFKLDNFEEIRSQYMCYNFKNLLIYIENIKTEHLIKKLDVPFSKKINQIFI